MKNTESKLINILISLILPLSVAALWTYVTNTKLVRGSILPSPQTVWNAAVSLFEQGILLEDLRASFGRIIKGFLIGSSTGILLGLIIGIWPVADKLSKFMIGIFRPIPIIALIPLFILWFGIEEISKVLVIAIGTFWSVLINTIEGIKGVDPKLLELTNMLRKSRWDTIRHVIIPNAFPSIFTGIRLSLAASLAFVITSEMIAASTGIGYRIMFARNMALPAIMFVGIIEIGFFGLITDLALLKLQKRLFSYR